MHVLGQRVAAGQQAGQVFGKGLNEINLQRKPQIRDRPRKGPRPAQKAHGAPRQTVNDPQQRRPGARAVQPRHMRFDFVMQPNGNVTINSRVYHGPGVRCRVQFRPIAGFSDPQEAATMTFLFARTPSGMWAPIQIEMPTDGVGLVRLEARRMSFNGQRL